MSVRLPAASRNAAVDAVCGRLNGGTVEIRTGAQPATAADAATGTLLATFTINNPAFDAAANGAAALVVTPQLQAAGAAAGDAGWWRAKTSGGATVMDGSCSATGGGGDLTLNTVAVSVGLALRLTGGTVSMPAG